MPDLNVEEHYGFDSSDSDEDHSKLLSSILQLDSTQRVKPAQRKEATSKVSEYNLIERIPSKKNLISVKELASVLGKSSKHGIITKKLKNVTSISKTLPKPMEKSVEEQIKRSIGFENVKNQLQRWDAVVTRNALKDQMKFPLNDNSMIMQKSDDFLSQFQSSTPLEKEIQKVLKEENKGKEDEDKEYSLTLEEMLEKRREMAYLRAKLSHKEAKAQRQNKIKSKKYHRILKREKLRQKLKEFEFLQKTDPEAALKKLSELDKTRAQERASLRHRNTGQWAKNLSVRAKYDPESRKILAEQLKISRELTQKVIELDDSDKEEAEKPALWTLGENAKLDAINKFGDNPWNIYVSKEVQDFVSGYKKYWNEQNKTATEDPIIKQTQKCSNENQEKCEMICENSLKTISEIQNPPQSDFEKSVKNKRKPEKSSTPENTTSVSIYPGSGVWIVTPVSDVLDMKGKKKRKGDDIETLFEELDEQLKENAVLKINKIKDQLKNEKNIKKPHEKKNIEKEFDLSINNKNMVERPDMDAGLLEGDDVDLEIHSEKNHVDKTEVPKDSKKAVVDIDPQNFIQVKPKKLRACLPVSLRNGDDGDDEKKQAMTIEEAFVDDDVIAEFKEMKEKTEKSEEINIEKSLPGWGEWGGLGIAPKTRKKPRLMVNALPRKEKGKKDTIINENANPNLKNHMVKEVPHPFRTVEAFEANIRAPVGREWVPETAHWKLIQKQVETKLGAVIEPMDEDEIVRQKKTHKSPYQKKIKNQEKKLHN